MQKQDRRAIMQLWNKIPPRGNERRIDMSDVNKIPEGNCPHCSPAPAETPCCAPAEGSTDCGCRHKQRTEEEYKHLITRLNRIEGQIRGIRSMVEKDVYCTDILVQAAAARSALNGFTRELIDQHLSTCVAEDLKNGGEEKLQEFLWILNKLV